MRYLFSTKSNAALNHMWLLIYRVTISAFMLTHGIPKLNRLISGNVGEFSDPLGVGHTMSLILTVFGEVVAPVLVILGLGTRFSAIPVAFAMAVAGFLVHSADPFARKELALMFLMGFLTIIVMGGGRYSLDNLLGKRR